MVLFFMFSQANFFSYLLFVCYLPPCLYVTSFGQTSLGLATVNAVSLFAVPGHQLGTLVFLLDNVFFSFDGGEERRRVK